MIQTVFQSISMSVSRSVSLQITNLVAGRQADGLDPLYVVAMEAEYVPHGQPSQQLHEGLAAHLRYPVEEHNIDTCVSRVVHLPRVQRLQLWYKARKVAR